MDDVCGAMVQMDMDGRITSFNHSAEDILGYKEDDVIGINGISSIFVNNVGDEDMLSVARNGEVYYSFESHVKNSDGEMQISWHLSHHPSQTMKAISPELPCLSAISFLFSISAPFSAYTFLLKIFK